MNKIRKILNQKTALMTGTVVAASVAAPSAFAATSLDAITTAITNGEALIGAVAPGVITIAAVMLGVGLVVSWLRK